MNRSGAGPESTVGIIGAGPIGLMTLAALRAAGVSRIGVAERSPSRRAIAEAVGATAVITDATRLESALGQELDVVFECAGVSTTPEIAIQCVRMGGRVMLVGIANPDPPVQLTSIVWVVKEVDVLPCAFYTTEEFANAVHAVASGAVDPALVVSAVRPLEEAEASFEDLAQPDGPVKVLLQPTA